MWSDDGDTGSDDDMSVDSVLDEETKKVIKSRLEEPLEFPLVCPVCFTCGYRGKRLDSRVALLQHAKGIPQSLSINSRTFCADKRDEKSPDMRKVEEHHATLVRKINQLEEMDTEQRCQQLTAVHSGVGGETLDPSFVRHVDRMDRIQRDTNDGRMMRQDMERAKRHKRQEASSLVAATAEARSDTRRLEREFEELQAFKLKALISVLFLSDGE